MKSSKGPARPRSKIITALLAVVISFFVPADLGAQDEYVFQPKGSPVWATISDFEVHDGFGYGALPFGIMVFDLDEPSGPAVLAKLQLGGRCTRVAVQANLAYVTSSLPAIHIVDIENPSSPSLIASVPLAQPIYQIEVLGQYLVVGTGRGFMVLDLTDNLQPEIVSEYEPGGGATVNQFAIYQEHMYLSIWEPMGSWGQIFDLTDPSLPVYVGPVDLGSGLLSNIRIAYPYLLYTDGSSEMCVLNIEDPVSPSFVSCTLHPDVSALGVAVSGSLAAVVGNGLVGFFDFSNPQAPVPGPSLPFSDVYSSTNGIASLGNYFYTFGTSLCRLDATEPVSPYQSGEAIMGDEGIKMEIQGDEAFFLESKGLHIFKVNDLEQWDRVAFLESQRHSSAMATDGRTLYLSSLAGLHVYDISNSHSPRQFNYADESCRANNMELHNGILYIADRNSGIRIEQFIITDVIEIVNYLGFYSAEYVTDLEVENGKVYFVDEAGDAGSLRILDAPLESIPTLIGEIYVGGELRHLAKSGNRVYTGSTNLVTIDVTNPESPTILGSYELGWSIQSLTTLGDNLVFVGTDGPFSYLFDTADPNNCRIVSVVDGHGGVSGCFTSGLNFYTFGEAGVQVFDVGLRATFPDSPRTTIDALDRIVQVVVDGEDGPTAGSFNYRPGGAGYEEYLSVPFQDTGSGVLNLTLSSTLLKQVRGLEYYITFGRGDFVGAIGSPDDPYVYHIKLDNRTARSELPLPDAAYRIVSVPLQVEGDNSVGAVFGDLEDLGNYDSRFWRLGSYDNANDMVIEFPDSDPVVPGRGFWLIARGNATFGAAGTTTYPDWPSKEPRYFAVDLDFDNDSGNGWNLLGNPFAFPVAWADVLFLDDGSLVQGHPASVIQDQAYWFNGQRYDYPHPFIPNWGGVAIHVNKPGITALIPYQEYKEGDQKRKRSEFKPPLWELEIILKSGNLIDANNMFGVAEWASDSIDPQDYHEPPNPPGTPKLAFVLNGFYGDQYFHTDYRSVSDFGSTWVADFASAAPARLIIQGADRLPSGSRGWIEINGQGKFPLNPNFEIDLDQYVGRLTIHVGNDDFLDETVGAPPPNKMALRPCYPNPSNPGTNIEFTLPSTQFVQLSIYDIRGRRVTNLVNEELPAGHHTKNWDGTDSSFRRVASGTYLVFIKSAGEILTRRIQVIR